MIELVYILWIAVGTAGFWESLEGVQRVREFKFIPHRAWSIFAGMAPIFWVTLIQIYFHPINLLIYGIITIIYMEILYRRNQNMLNSVFVLILQLMLYSTVPAWHMQAERFWVILIVELLAMGFYIIKKNPVWAIIGIAIWMFGKPFFFPAHDQLNDFIDMAGLFLPLFLYAEEFTRRLQIMFERSHDPLTGLLNRMSFNDWLLEARGTKGVLMVVDLDDFKYINDTFGHQVGDQVLGEMGRKISQALESRAKAFRWGGDEFVIVCSDLENQEAAFAMAQDVYQQMMQESAHPLAAFPFPLSASMGAAYGEMNAHLFTLADAALIQTKRSGKNKMGWYQDDLEYEENISSFPMDFAQVKAREQDVQIANAVWENAYEGMVITDLHGVILRVNRAFTYVTGYTPEEVVGKNPSILSSGRHSASFYKDMWDKLVTSGVWQGKIENRKKNGEIYWERLQIRQILDQTNSPLFYLATFTDLTQLKTLLDDV